MNAVLVVAIGVLVVGLLVLSYRATQQRRQALQAWATSLGLSYTKERDESLEARFPEFACLRQGARRYGYNLCEGQLGSVQLSGPGQIVGASRLSDAGKLCAFDYHYETYSHGKHGRTTHHHHFSALILETKLPLRSLMLRPEHFGDRLAEFFGVDDIDFESAEFSKRFHVKAPDRSWAFDVLHQETMEFLLASPEFSLELHPHRAMAYRGKTFRVEEFAAALAVLNGVLGRLPPSVLQELRTT
ncbi:MAG: hypothetical protein ACT4PU_07330 [Planctomycetota bacterium]